MVWFNTFASGVGKPSGSGAPFMTAPGVFDPTTLGHLSRYALVMTNVTPSSNYDNDNWGWVAQLRALNPKTKLLAFESLQWRYQNTNHMLADLWNIVLGTEPGGSGAERMIRINGGAQNGLPFPSGNTGKVWWDVTQNNGANVLRDLWIARVMNHGLDGVFFDTCVSSLYNDEGQTPNFGAKGYGSQAAMEAALATASGALIDALRAYGGVWGNMGYWLATETMKRKATGELLEYWDPGQGATGAPDLPGFGWFANFDAAMTHLCTWQGSDPTGDGTVMLKTENAAGLSDYADGTGPTNATWRKLNRYSLACATIAGGYHHHGKGADGQSSDTIYDIGDEWSVDIASGQCMKDNAHMGWLGRPTEFGSMYASGLWVRRFQNGIVVVNGPSVSRTITFEKPYKRLTGTWETTINNGATVSSDTIPSKDGRFYVNV